MAKEHLIGEILKRIKRPVKLIENQEYKLVTIKMNHKGVVLRENKMGSLIKSNMYMVKEGDFILSGIDARNGAFGIVPKELDGAIVTNDFWYFKIDETIISKQLFLELTATTWFDEICKRGSDGTTQRIRLQNDKFFNQKILLPEGHEQEELLNKILSFKSIQSRLSVEIQTQKYLLSQLKQSILQEAIQGKLTEDWRMQHPENETASELLKRIKAEKAKLIKEGKIKKENPLPPITKEEIPFELPEGWVWCRLNDIITLLGDGLHGTPVFSDTGEYFFINGNNLVDGVIEIKPNTKRIDVTEYLKYKKTLTANSLLVSINGSLGNIAFYNNENIILGKSACYFNLIDGSWKHYLKRIIESRYFLQYAISESSKTTINNLSLKNMRLLPIPLPPLEEQKAIVQKVETLMEKCRALEAEIAQSEQHAQMLMQAVLKEAFEPKPTETKSVGPAYQTEEKMSMAAEPEAN